MKKKIAFVLLAFVVVLSACLPSQQQVDEIVSSVEQTALAQVTVVAPTQNLDQIVQATFQALTAQAPSSTPIPSAAQTGSIAGRVEQRAKYIGVFDINSDAIYRLEVPSGASSYQIDNIPPGTYYVMSFIESNFMAPFPMAYSKYVTCGMSTSCTDHTLIPVTVVAGQVTQGVDAIDNWGNPDLIAYVDRFYGVGQNGGTDNIPTFTPMGGLSGSIAGQLSYPSQGIPAMAVVAFSVDGIPGTYYYVLTNDNQNTYQIDNLPAGKYTVVAYPMNNPTALSGGYTNAVPCGLLVSCTDHSLISVTVTGGQVTQGVNPQDWYAPTGTFPAYPLP